MAILSTCKYRAFGNNVVLAKRNPRVSEGGILLPDNAMTAVSCELLVVSKGPNTGDDVKVGDNVFVKPGADVFMFPPDKQDSMAAPDGRVAKVSGDEWLYFCAGIDSIAAVIEG